jgi:hypothetical protein
VKSDAEAESDSAVQPWTAPGGSSYQTSNTNTVSAPFTPPQLPNEPGSLIRNDSSRYGAQDTVINDPPLNSSAVATSKITKKLEEINR